MGESEKLAVVVTKIAGLRPGEPEAKKLQGLIAQLVEHTADNGEVDGSSPSGPIGRDCRDAVSIAVRKGRQDDRVIDAGNKREDVDTFFRICRPWYWDSGLVLWLGQGQASLEAAE